MSKRERRIIIGLFATALLLVVVAGGLSYSIDYNKRYQIAYDSESTRSAEIMNDVSLTWEAKSKD